MPPPAQEQVVEGSAGGQPRQAKDKSEQEQLHSANEEKTAGGVGKGGLMRLVARQSNECQDEYIRGDKDEMKPPPPAADRLGFVDGWRQGFHLRRQIVPAWRLRRKRLD
jgi:hypothetical protein